MDLRGREMDSDSEPGLDFNLCNIPDSIGGFVREVSLISDPAKRLMKVQELLNCLEEEKKKVEAFKRELPFCMLLINEAIEAVKGGENQCQSLAKSRPIEEESVSAINKLDEDRKIGRETDSRDKMSWMSSVQLWSNHCENSEKTKSSMNLKEKADGSEPHNQFPACKGMGNGGFLRFSMVSGLPEKKGEIGALQRPPVLSLASPGIKNLVADSRINATNLSSAFEMNHQSNSQQQQPLRKQRRCWSPELHGRFVNALIELGGSQVATPKQIRELMKVDGLTNDEVKSHLQKYRLHSLRVLDSEQSSMNMGGVWVPNEHQRGTKSGTAQSGSPQGPLQLSRTSRGISASHHEEDEDRKSESYSWKSQMGSSEDTE